MYLGAPYHNPYQYQHNTQRYPGQQPANPSSSQYLPTNQPQAKPSGSQYGGYNSGAQNSLPPYAEYQEYKKRESDRRRWNGKQYSS